MPRKILDIDVDEISVVDLAANRKKFYIRKGAVQMDELLKTLQAFLGADVVKEDDFKTLKATLTEEQAAEIKSAVDTLAKYKADFPDDVLAAVQTLMKSALAAPVEEPFNVEKYGAKLSKATVEDLKKIRDILNGLLPDLEEEAKRKSATPPTDPYAGLAPEVAARLRKLDDLEKAEAAAVAKAADTEKKALTEKITKLEAEVELLKKSRGQSSQKTDEGDPEPKEKVQKKDEPFEWTSLRSQEE